MRNNNRLTSVIIAAYASSFPIVSYSDSQVLEEIVVTSQKRSESLQDIPASISAISGSDLDKQGIYEVSELFRGMPGLHFGNHQDMKTSETSIRGVRSESRSAGQDPAVGYYLDEVFLGPGVSSSIDYFDIQQIEVLRGPQGTLFGRNTIGGAINITSRKPTDEPEGYVEIGVGNYNLFETKAAISGPIIEDKLLFRLAGSMIKRDGYGENLITGTDLENADRYSLRGSLTFTPNEKFEASFTADYRKVKQNTNALETLNYADGSGNFLALTIGGFPGPNSDPWDRDTYGDIDPSEKLEMWGGNLRLEWELPFADLISVSGYRGHKYAGIYDTEQTAARWTYSSSPEKVWRFSEEIRLVSNQDNSLEWIVGSYFYKQYTDNQFTGLFGQELTDFFGLPAGFKLTSEGLQNVESYAVFANASYQISPEWSVKMGGRYTYEKKDIEYEQIDIVGLVGGSREFEADRSTGEFTPMVSVQYEPNDNSLMYALVSKGFKSGGYNDFLGDATATGFDSESLWNYELGFKGTFMEGKLIANASIFYMDWEDIQLQVDNPNTPFFDPATRNAGTARSQGLELEITSSPTEHLQLSAGISLLDAEFTDGTLPNGDPLREIPRAPDFTGNIQGVYTFPLSEDYKLDAMINYSIVGSHYLDISNIGESKVDSYNILNGHIRLYTSDDKWSLTLWGRNLTDDTHKTRSFDLISNPLTGQHLIALNAPRTYGLKFQYNF